MRAWREMNPEFDYRLWRLPDLDELQDLPEQWRWYIDGRGRLVWMGAADVVRVSILDQFGGVYVDADTQPLRPLLDAPFMNARFFAAGDKRGQAKRGKVRVGVMGAEPGHPLLAEYLRRIRAVRPKSVRSKRAKPTIFGHKILTSLAWDWDGREGVEILPTGTFFPVGFRGRDFRTDDPPYARHLWHQAYRFHPEFPPNDYVPVRSDSVRSRAAMIRRARRAAVDRFMGHAPR